MANEVAEKKEFTTSISQWSNEITSLIARDYDSCGVEFDDYSKKCAMEAMSSIFNLVKTSGKDIRQIDTSNLRGIALCDNPFSSHSGGVTSIPLCFGGI